MRICVFLLASVPNFLSADPGGTMRVMSSKVLLLILVFSQAVPAQSLLTRAASDSTVQLRMERVERGLLPPVLIKGQTGWSIQERLKHYKIPGVSVAVINDFKIEWAKAYGVKDIETNEAVTTETLFQAGSISKPVAAMVALKKVEQGKITLDEDINNKLTSWKLPDNELTAKRKVTLANLLSHTGGTTVHGFPGYAIGEKIPTLPEVLDGSGPANTAPVRVDLEPGTKHRYSGGGTTIAQLAIMDIEKKPYPRIAQETVLGPLNMTSSTYEQPLPAETRKKAASGHRSTGKLVDGKIHVYPEMAAAGLWTTPTDLAKFGIEVQLSLAGKSNKVLSKETAAKMVTPFIEDFIGLGFFIEKHGAATYFGHGGADEGFRAQLLVNRDKGYGAVVMVNSDNGQVINEIFRSIAAEYKWDDYLPKPVDVVSVDSKKLDDYVGRFLVNPDRVIKFTRENGKLYGEPTQTPKFELFAISESEFQRSDAEVRYTFLKSADGKVDQIQLRFPGGESKAPRISEGTAIPYELLMDGKFIEAAEAYKKIKRETPNHGVVSEARLNGLGYSLLQEAKVAEAIVILKLNTELYPQSSNVYDSLGEAYLAKGDRESAAANFKKSLELNPRNKNAADMLKKLKP